MRPGLSPDAQELFVDARSRHPDAVSCIDGLVRSALPDSPRPGEGRAVERPDPSGRLRSRRPAFAERATRSRVSVRKRPGRSPVGVCGRNVSSGFE